MTKTNFTPNDQTKITATRPKITLPASAPLNMRGNVIIGAETDDTFETSLVNYQSLVNYVASNGTIGLTFKSNTLYTAGEFVIELKKLYFAKVEFTSVEVFNSEDWYELDVTVSNSFNDAAFENNKDIVFTRNDGTTETIDISGIAHATVITWGDIILNYTPGTEGSDATDDDGNTDAKYIEYTRTELGSPIFFRIFNNDQLGEIIRQTSKTTGTITATKTY